MSHQRAPGFGRPSHFNNDGYGGGGVENGDGNLNVGSSRFWTKSSNLLTPNPLCFPFGSQFIDSPATSSSGSSNCRFDQSPSPMSKDEFLWKNSSINPISIPMANQSRPLGVSVSTSSPNNSSTINYSSTNSNNSLINGNRVKSTIQSRDQSTTTHDLLAQFLGLCLDNQQSMLDVNLNSFSLSSSHGSSYINKLIDSSAAPSCLNQPNIPWRKLKARSEETPTSVNLNISLDHYNPNSMLAPSKGSGGTRRKNRRGSCIECVFCKNNGQPASFYQSHVLKDVLGRVTCPILSAYDCPICHNGGGPKAHTVRYCPENKPSNRLRNALLKSQIG